MIIQGKFSNNFVIAANNLTEIQHIIGEQTIKRNKQQQIQNKSVLRMPGQNQQQNNQEQQKLPIDYTYLQIKLPDIPQLNVNEKLTQPSYFESVKNLPLPQIDLEEKILLKTLTQKDHYKGIQELVQGEYLQKSKIQNSKIQPNGGDNNNPYFYKKDSNLSEEEQENNRQIQDFLNFTGTEDKKVAEQYVSQFPYDTEKQVNSYYKNSYKKEEQRKKEQRLQENIEKFQKETGADLASTKEYLQKHNDLVTAITNYKNEQQSQSVNTFIEQTNCSLELARTYINRYGDIVVALQNYQTDQLNKKQNLLQEFKKGTNLSDQEAKFYLDATGNDLQAAKKMYKEYNG